MNTSWAASSASLSFFRIDIARLKIFPWYWRSSSSTAKELPARSPASSSLSAPVGAGGLSCSRTTHVAARLPVEEKAPRAGRLGFADFRQTGIVFGTQGALSNRIGDLRSCYCYTNYCYYTYIGGPGYRKVTRMPKVARRDRVTYNCYTKYLRYTHICI